MPLGDWEKFEAGANFTWDSFNLTGHLFYAGIEIDLDNRKLFAWSQDNSIYFIGEAAAGGGWNVYNLDTLAHDFTPWNYGTYDLNAYGNADREPDEWRYNIALRGAGYSVMIWQYGSSNEATWRYLEVPLLVKHSTMQVVDEYTPLSFDERNPQFFYFPVQESDVWRHYIFGFMWDDDGDTSVTWLAGKRWVVLKADVDAEQIVAVIDSADTNGADSGSTRNYETAPVGLEDRGRSLNFLGFLTQAKSIHTVHYGESYTDVYFTKINSPFSIFKMRIPYDFTQASDLTFSTVYTAADANFLGYQDAIYSSFDDSLIVVLVTQVTAPNYTVKVRKIKLSDGSTLWENTFNDSSNILSQYTFWYRRNEVSRPAGWNAEWSNPQDCSCYFYGPSSWGSGKLARTRVLNFNDGTFTDIDTPVEPSSELAPADASLPSPLMYALNGKEQLTYRLWAHSVFQIEGDFIYQSSVCPVAAPWQNVDLLDWIPR